MITFLFNAGVDSLLWLAAVLNMSYEQVNILFYVIFLPTVWSVIIDRSYKKDWSLPLITLISTMALVILISTERTYDLLVDFEYWLSIANWDYYQASVYTCVFAPVAITLVLIADYTRKKMFKFIIK